VRSATYVRNVRLPMRAPGCVHSPAVDDSEGGCETGREPPAGAGDTLPERAKGARRWRFETTVGRCRSATRTPGGGVTKMYPHGCKPRSPTVGSRTMSRRGNERRRLRRDRRHLDAVGVDPVLAFVRLEGHLVEPPIVAMPTLIPLPTWQRDGSSNCRDADITLPRKRGPGNR